MQWKKYSLVYALHIKLRLDQFVSASLMFLDQNCYLHMLRQTLVKKFVNNLFSNLHKVKASFFPKKQVL